MAVSPSISSQPIRLFLLDDHALFREGLVRLLDSDPEFVLHGSSGDPGSALAVITRENINVLLLDYDLGENHSAESYVAELRASGFTGKILLVTAGLPDRDALRIIRAGVSGI